MLGHSIPGLLGCVENSPCIMHMKRNTCSSEEPIAFFVNGPYKIHEFTFIPFLVDERIVRDVYFAGFFFKKPTT